MPSISECQSPAVGEDMTRPIHELTPFNTPLETGIRSTCLLVSAYPQSFDLQRLVAFDHLVVHTGDIGGPASLHPELPLRSAELLVRRGLVERGLLLMASRGLVERSANSNGIFFLAGDLSATFLASLESFYIRQLRDRAAWVMSEFGALPDETFYARVNGLFDNWVGQFQSVRTRIGGAS